MCVALDSDSTRTGLAVTCLFVLITAFESQGQFTDMTLGTGILHYHLDNQVIGGGVAIFDYDGDGLEDVYLTGGDIADKLLHNLGDWQFENVSVSAGIPPGTRTMGVVSGDVNNDGHADLFLATRAGQACVLLINNGNGTFTDVSAQSGITHDTWSTAAVMADVNSDGWLDIYVANYVQQYNGVTLDDDGILLDLDVTCTPNLLYVNQGDGTFIEMASNYGCDDVGCGLAAAFSDANGDGYPDIIVVNDFGEYHLPNILLIHPQSDSPFIDDTENNQFSFAISGMGVAIGDPDNDGDFDYYLTNLGANVFAVNDGQGNFSEQAAAFGIDDPTSNGLPSTGWGTAFLDVDLDGWEDLYVANGYITTGTMLTNALENIDRLFINNMDGTFTDRGQELGVSSPDWGRGMAYGDIDNDGDLDIIVTVADNAGMNGQRSRFYRNDLSTSNHWLKIRLEGTVSNRSGFGSIVTVYCDGLVHTRELHGGSSCASQNTSVLHFGLGSASNVDSVVVRFPSGSITTRYDVDVDQVIQVTEGEMITSSHHFDQCSIMSPRVTEEHIYFPTCLQGLEKQVTIHDMMGRLVFRTTTHEAELQTPKTPVGFFVLSVQHGTLMTRDRVIIP